MKKKFKWEAGTVILVPNDQELMCHPARHAERFPKTPGVIRVIVRKGMGRFAEIGEEEREADARNTFGVFGGREGRHKASRGHALFVPAGLKALDFIFIEWVDRGSFSACARLATDNEIEGRADEDDYRKRFLCRE